MNTTIIKKLLFLKNKTIKFLLLQLYITLFLWPILIYWGLPLSYLSPIGNLIFAPFLFIFLFISTFIFIFQIIFIPNQWLITILEYFTLLWYKTISLSKKNWLIACSQPHISFCLILPIIATLILHNKKLNSNYIKIVSLFLLFFCSFLFFRYPKNNIKSCSIDCFKKKIELLAENNKISILEKSCLSQNGTPSWTKYNLLPSLYKKGIYSIDEIRIEKINENTILSLIEFCRIFPIKIIYMPNFDLNHKNKICELYEKLKKLCQENAIKIIHKTIISKNTELT